jgi:hypothetical protein
MIMGCSPTFSPRLTICVVPAGIHFSLKRKNTRFSPPHFERNSTIWHDQLTCGFIFIHIPQMNQINIAFLFAADPFMIPIIGTKILTNHMNRCRFSKSSIKPDEMMRGV